MRGAMYRISAMTWQIFAQNPQSDRCQKFSGSYFDLNPPQLNEAGLYWLSCAGHKKLEMRLKAEKARTMLEEEAKERLGN